MRRYYEIRHNAKILLRFGIIIGFALLGFMWSGINYDKEYSTSYSLGSSEPEAVKVLPHDHRPLAVSAIQLFKDYSADEAASDKKYKGKMLELAGVLETIKRDPRNNVYLVIYAGDLQIVQCSISPGYKGRAGLLSVGQTVTVLGEGASTIGGTPILVRCALK